jgi:3-hydroxyacyl-CoA dehydrogenase/3a,7a,12a-trihydroxy-5b-cholest-24-enoyl-CoA hydratase
LGDQLRFDGKAVIVTGAGRGLGRMYALELGRRGATVIVNDLGVGRDGEGRSPTPAQDVVDEICAAGGAALPNCADVSAPEDAAALVDLAHRTAPLSAIINNAGVFPLPKPFEETTLEEFAQAWRNHCGGTYNICRAALPTMRAANFGRIVNTVSIQGLYGAATSAAYASAKGAVQALTLSLAAAVRGTGVAVNALSPGGFTRMLDDESRPPAMIASLQRNLDPALAAPMAIWLCHQSCDVNGQIYQAYAGRVSRTVIGELEGVWDFAPSAESVAQNASSLRADGPLITAPDSASKALAVFQEADARRAKH